MQLSKTQQKFTARLQETLRDEMIDRLSEILKQFLLKCDHLHLLFQYTLQTELPKFINNIKTVKSFSNSLRSRSVS